jgi:RNA polymerase sigma-70 factor (ECF subfamily)
MEGPKLSGQFATTHWSVVLSAGQNASAQQVEALEKLCQAYWQPIFVFARHKGWSEADAKDLTQQFFARLLARNDFAGVNPVKGKFRTFLLTAFTHFLSNEYDRQMALKRGGNLTFIALTECAADSSWGLAAPAEEPPATAFDVQWAGKILATAVQNLKREMAADGKAKQFEVLKSFLTADGNQGSYAGAAASLRTNVTSVPMQVSRLRRRFRELVRNEVAQTVSSPVELNEEMRHLFQILNR